MDRHARKIKPSKGKHYRWKVPFFKKCKMVHCESSLERDYVRLADFDPKVVDIIYQPLVINYLYKNRKRKYYPDFKVIKKDGTVLIIEVKPFSKINKPENVVKFLVGKLYCEKFGWDFHVVTENEIRRGALQNNLSLLRSLGNQPVEIQNLKLILNTLQSTGKCSIEMLRSNSSEVDEVEFYKNLYALIYHKKAYVDLINEEINDLTYISCSMEREA